ncbi:hypothetical protein [Gluconacetobacter tumulisoli]|uniref:Uncharacterized protein n=1 Tax=Gluconacetobacter tumulisoli TaxID=1286189 RepID=A0A7W4PN82_9PROT|nr:hypothetical protein [Gluconacetobacter tumulisoli]MBB2200606.1 hypothetical protein [Gluconacetobacter tumulisoli]
MLESHIVEIDGTFVGTVILEDDHETRRFYATHDSVRAFHNRILRERDDLTRQVARLFRTARAGAGASGGGGRPLR